MCSVKNVSTQEIVGLKKYSDPAKSFSVSYPEFISSNEFGNTKIICESLDGTSKELQLEGLNVKIPIVAEPGNFGGVLIRAQFDTLCGENSSAIYITDIIF